LGNESENPVNKQEKRRRVLVIPCSGIGRVHGLISREATYLVTDELAPKETDTVCLGLLVKGDSGVLDTIKSRACITIDGCPKACAEKNVKIAGGIAVSAVQITNVLKGRQGAKPGSATELTHEGWAIAREIAGMVADTAARLGDGEEAIP
jgi:uncharacterized metal-binding protein